MHVVTVIIICLPYLDLVLPLGLGVGGDPVDAPYLGEHGAVAQGEAQVQQPVGRRAHSSEQGIRDLESRSSD